MLLKHCTVGFVSAEAFENTVRSKALVELPFEVTEVRSKSLVEFPFEVAEAFENTCMFEITGRDTVRNLVLSINTRLYKEAVRLQCTRLHSMCFHSAPCMSMHGLTLVYIYIYTPQLRMK